VSNNCFDSRLQSKHNIQEKFRVGVMGSESDIGRGRSNRYKGLLDRGFSKEEKKALLGRYVPAEVAEEELGWFCTVCLESRLNPFLGEIAADWDFDESRPTTRKLVAITKISGYRAIADRTGLYRGQTTPVFCGVDAVWKEVWFDEDPPKACKIGVLRADFAEPLYAVVLFKEHERRAKYSPYWRESPVNQLAIRTEAAALKKAFPQLNALVIKEEIEGKKSPEDLRGAKEVVDGEPEKKPLVIVKTAWVEAPAQEERKPVGGEDLPVQGGNGDRDEPLAKKSAPPSNAVGTPYDYIVSLSGGRRISLGEISSDLFQGLCRKHLLKSGDFESRGSAKEYLGKVFMDLVEAGEALKETTLAGRGVKIAGRTVRLTLNDWRGIRLGHIEVDPNVREKLNPIIKRYSLGESEKFLSESANPERPNRRVLSTRGL
jgi:hypothetical protein